MSLQIRQGGGDKTKSNWTEPSSISFGSFVLTHNRVSRQSDDFCIFDDARVTFIYESACVSPLSLSISKLWIFVSRFWPFCPDPWRENPEKCKKVFSGLETSTRVVQNGSELNQVCTHGRLGGHWWQWRILEHHKLFSFLLSGCVLVALCGYRVYRIAALKF